MLQILCSSVRVNELSTPVCLFTHRGSERPMQYQRDLSTQTGTVFVRGDSSTTMVHPSVVIA